MAELIIHTENIKKNIRSLSDYFKGKSIEWSLITKVFSGDPDFLKHVLTDDVIENINSVGDSRLTSLKNLREVNPDMRTIYIKPPAIVYADDVVKYADISLNSSLDTILALNEAAQKQDLIHRVIIMIELGELREGVNGEDIVHFYERVFNLPHVEVIGIGSNLGCMYGVEPTVDKLMQLSLYKELISERFDKRLPLISGGTSITLPMLESGNLPEEINHFRIGEAAFFGISPLKNEPFLNLSTNTFEFEANILELERKQLVPEGVIGDANIGHTAEVNNNQTGSSLKAILDFGLMDVDHTNLETTDQDLSFVGITSDMMVVDVGDNEGKDGKPKYETSQPIRFTPNYMGVARLLSSKFIDKRYV